MISLESLARLGWSYARVLGSKLVRRRTGIHQFVTQYAPDGIVAFEPDDAPVLASASRCTACGRCNVVALERGMFSSLGASGPMGFVLGVSRHSARHDQVGEGAALSPDDLRALRAGCPVGVSFDGLVSLVRRRARALESVRPSRALARWVH